MADELKLLDRRNESDQGVPVFLVCENLASREARQIVHGEGSVLAERLRRAAISFDELHPGATEKDLSKVIEILAERDFGVTLLQNRP